jgi:uncharacterized protein YndB with AHSA1/START domain
MEVKMKWLKRIAIVLAALIVLPILTLLIMGQRSGAGQTRVVAEIHASPQQLWPWLENGDRLKQWVSWLVDVQTWNPPQPGAGAKRVLKMRDENNGNMIMDIENTCLEYAPPSRLTLQLAIKDEFDGRQTYTLTDLGNGSTRLEVLDQYRFTDRLAQLLEPLITPSARKKMEGDVARLKGLVESQAALH